MRNKLYIWVLVAVILLASVLAVKPTPTVQASSMTGLQVEYPKQSYFKAYQPDLLHFHVYNSTNYLVTNATTTCNIHIYNNTGNHIIEQDMLFDSNGVDFFYALPESIVNRTGEYSYTVGCSNSKEAGFLSTSFFISETLSMDDPMNYISMAVIISVILFAMFYLGLTLKDEHFALKLFLLWIGIILFVPLSQIAVQVATSNGLEPGILVLVNVFNYATIIMAIVTTLYFGVYILTRTLTFFKSIVKNPLRRK